MRAILLAATFVVSTTGFSPAQVNRAAISPLFRPNTRRATSSQINAAASASASSSFNPLKKLPWNAKKEREREARRIKQESARLHRELGIPEGATFEEITEATDALIKKCDGDVKKTIKIEVTKDRIMQIRLNERLAGLATETREARQQSYYEDDDSINIESKPKKKEDDGEGFWSNLVVKPDDDFRNTQIIVWGGLTLMGILLPPLCEKLEYMNWLLAVGQMSFRGMPKNQDGFSLMGNRRNSGKNAWLLAGSIWLFMKLFTTTFVRRIGIAGERWAPSVELAMTNFVLGLATAYLQPCKPQD